MTGGAATRPPAAGGAAPGRPASDVWRRLRRRPLGVVGVAGSILFVLVAVVGPWVAPHDPLALRPDTLQPPGRPYWLGTDELGRDVLSGLLHGARVSLVVGLASSAGAVLVGVAVGAAAGYWRGRVDDLLMRVTEWFLVVPQFLLVLVVAAIFGADLGIVIVVLAGVSWPTTARLTRAEFLSLAEREFVLAARSLGAAILSEASLRFLGLSDPTRPSWGAMLNAAQNFLQQAWWLPVFPGAAIFFTVLFLNLAGEALNDALDPRRLP